MWRMRRSVKKRLLFGGICIAVQLLLFSVGQAVVYRITTEKYERILEEKENRLVAAGRMVYITKNEVKAGEILTEENIEKRYLLSEQNPEALATDVVGMKACADLPEGVIISTALCCKADYTTSERKCIFNKIGFTENFAEYDVVDVRLRYANGENYCVLKKKQLYKDEAENNCGFYLTESEQLLMSAAQYDVEVYDGAELYVVGFMEARLQENAVSEYLPPVQVLTQLQEWNEEYGNIYRLWCERRIHLEQRLAEHRRQRREGLL